ncbi:MAG: ion transporter [Chlamydiales bacterium]|nr:ion transporter [Chlamydiia bacterium]MCP5508773.1 ion transporter [Chlamydiales bacterium]
MAKSSRLEKFRNYCDQMLNFERTAYGRAYAVVMALLVLIICANFVIETYPISSQLYDWLRLSDRLISVIFLFDYLLRWWVKRFDWRYPFTPMAIVDLVSILPLFFSGMHWQFVRVLRIFRILRLLRMFKDKGAFFGQITELRLRILKILFTLFCLLFVSSGLMYEVEQDTFPNFFDAFYFSIVTLTTVGYGDVVPLSLEGKFIAILMIVSGVLLIPWQLMGLARILVGDIHKRDVECPKCGFNIHDIDAKHCKVCGELLPKEDARG